MSNERTFTCPEPPSGMAPWPDAATSLSILWISLHRLADDLRRAGGQKLDLKLELDDDVFDAITEPKREEVRRHLQHPERWSTPIDAPMDIGGITLVRRLRPMPTKPTDTA